LLVLLVTILVTVTGYALVQSLQTSQQTIGKAVHQPPGNYTLTVYLTAAVQGHSSGIIDGVKAYTAASIGITFRV